jgi:hypothetical protein
MAYRTHRIILDNSDEDAPLTITERSVPPTTPEVDAIYLDDGTNYGGGVGVPGFRRWTGSAWEDLGSVSSGITNVDGGRAAANYGGVGLSPLDGGDASSW